MVEIFKKYQVIILRVLGAFMLVVGFSAHFWSTPKKGLSQSELAAANVARMEASVAGSATSKSAQPKHSPFLKKLQSTKEKQIRYITIIAMLFGVGFLLYSFIAKPKHDSEQ